MLYMGIGVRNAQRVRSHMSRTQRQAEPGSARQQGGWRIKEEGNMYLLKQGEG